MIRNLRNLLLGFAMLATAGGVQAGERRAGGKLILTNGISTLEGSAGGGLASWAVIAGNETRDGIGATAHATIVALPDFDLESYGAAIGAFDRIELSYTHQSFDTRKAGAALGLGRGFLFGQHVIGAKVRVAGDAVWDQDSVLPQVAIGAQYHIADKAPVLRAVGAKQSKSVDFYASATKVLLAQGAVLNATVRYTKANQFGLLGFGGDNRAKRTLQFEGSAGVLLSPSIVIGGEYRTKPDNLGFAQEDDSYDLFAAWAFDRHVTLTAAYADVGDIATVKNQHGLFLSLQAGF